MILQYVGIDVGEKSSSFCVVNESGDILLEQEISTEKRDIVEFAKKLDNAMCVVEACGLAEWMYNVIKSTGHIIDIVDPRDAKKALSKKRKTDKLDARALAQLARSKWYTKVHCKSAQARHFRSLLAARSQLVKTAQALRSSIRGILLSNGVKLPKGQKKHFADDVRTSMKTLDPIVKRGLRPLLKLSIEAEIQAEKEYKELTRLSMKNETTKLLQTIPSIGPATATAFVATIDDPKRFSGAGKVAAYVGLVPSIHQSGKTEIRGRITKQGDGLLRWLLVEAAHVLLYCSKGEHPLKIWGLKLADKKGVAKAKVAVARKLACLMHHVWIKGEAYSLCLASKHMDLKLLTAQSLV